MFIYIYASMSVVSSNYSFTFPVLSLDDSDLFLNTSIDISISLGNSFTSRISIPFRNQISFSFFIVSTCPWDNPLYSKLCRSSPEQCYICSARHHYPETSFVVDTLVHFLVGICEWYAVISHGRSFFLPPVFLQLLDAPNFIQGFQLHFVMSWQLHIPCFFHCLRIKIQASIFLNLITLPIPIPPHQQRAALISAQVLILWILGSSLLAIGYIDRCIHICIYT